MKGERAQLERKRKSPSSLVAGTFLAARVKTAAKSKCLSTSWRLGLLFCLAAAAFQLLFSAPIAPVKSVPGLENRAWKIFSLAFQRHQPSGAQVSEPQWKRAPPPIKLLLSDVLAPENATPSITAAPYGDLRRTLPKGIQAHHLNQDAAFRDAIPSKEGLAIGMYGNAFTQPATPHYDFHASLEGFWASYRRGGDLYPSLPTNAEYHQALQQALQAGGFTLEEAGELARQAAEQRQQFDLNPDDPVPRVPQRLPQKKPGNK